MTNEESDTPGKPRSNTSRAQENNLQHTTAEDATQGGLMLVSGRARLRFAPGRAIT